MKHWKVLWLAFSIFIACEPFHVGAQIWQPLDNGIPEPATAVTAALGMYAAAYTTGIQKDIRVHEISIWNGVYWSKLPTIYADSNSKILSILFKDSGLYIAGKFTRFNLLDDVRNIVFWRDGKYHTLPAMSSTSNAKEEIIEHLDYLGERLVVAGKFKNDAQSGGDNLAFFKEGKWIDSGLASSLNINGTVHTTTVVGNRLVIGGEFTKIGNLSTQYVAGLNSSVSLRHEKNEYIPVEMLPYDTSVLFYGKHATDKSKAPSFFLLSSDTLESALKGIDKVINIQDIFSDGDKIFAIGEFELSSASETQYLIQFRDGEWEEVAGGGYEGMSIGFFWRNQIVVSGPFKALGKLELMHVARYQADVGAVIGKVYYDKDANCDFNNRDELLNDRIIQIAPGDVFIRPDEKGKYMVFLKEGKYTFTILPKKYWNASPCDKLSKTVVVKNGQVNDSADFALVQDTSVRDLSVKLIAQTGGLAPKTNKQLYYINFENLGSSEVVNGFLTLHFDDKLKNLNASIPPMKVEGDSAVWRINQLIPGVKQVIKCKFDLEDGSDDKLHLMAKISDGKATMDYDQDNNESSLTQKITEEQIEIGKQVNPGMVTGDTAFILPTTKTVDYQISFSNYSDDTVNTVYVIDTIQINHSMQVIRETGASHPYTYQILPGTPGENIAVIIWTFPNIRLAPNPTKNGEIVNDDGYIGFSIGLKPGLSVGNILTNTAQVAFDYSDQKNSNEVFAVISDHDAIIPVTVANGWKIYPNPVNDIINVELPENNRSEPTAFFIYSLDGRLLIDGQLQLETEQNISVQNLSTGIYILVFSNQKGSWSSRIVKN
ncbi:MAG: T9SS type A sorting domain-containing protein [Bacteroidetes bacterium]|nr:T9SS type A sorting domain-containing protein [Bacteroidota bacterium]